MNDTTANSSTEGAEAPRNLTQLHNVLATHEARLNALEVLANGLETVAEGYQRLLDEAAEDRRAPVTGREGDLYERYPVRQVAAHRLLPGDEITWDNEHLTIDAIRMVRADDGYCNARYEIMSTAGVKLRLSDDYPGVMTNPLWPFEARRYLPAWKQGTWIDDLFAGPTRPNLEGVDAVIFVEEVRPGDVPFVSRPPVEIGLDGRLVWSACAVEATRRHGDLILIILESGDRIVGKVGTRLGVKAGSVPTDMRGPEFEPVSDDATESGQTEGR